MKDTPANLDQRIAARVSGLRAERGLSLAALAERSGVSRSMISVIERGESSPTAVVLEKLATGLGVVLATLFDQPNPTGSPLSRRAGQAVWQDPASGYRRRNVSPVGTEQPMSVIEVEFPPGSRVAFESGTRESQVYQQVWILRGAIDITVGKDRHHLREGDCLAMVLDRPTLFHNPGRTAARYAVVIAADRKTAA